ncbi:MAG: hypothetical protein ACTHMS_02230 [Jatrophihabitans sp.]|uniref:hypothetical protein n=1 Tax=Jatrophihabitans sp. TaxID=1932789 RepID=UPI003F7EBF48
MSRRTPSAGRRLSVFTIDQAIAGASNVLASILAARLLPVASFALFGIVFLVYVMATGVSRALVGDPLLVHPVEARARTREVLGAGVVIGLGLAALLAVTGAVLLAPLPGLGRALLVLAVCTPLLVLQDLGRYLGFALDRPGSAVLLDSVWLGLLVVVAPLLALGDARTLGWFVVAWGGTGALAGVITLWLWRHRGVGLGTSWLRFTWPFSWRYLISYSATQGSALTASTGIGAIAGARQLGGVQGTLLLVRPFSMFQTAAMALGVVDIAKHGGEVARARRTAKAIALLVGGVAAVNAVVMLLLPASIGRVVLGSTWDVARPLLLPTGVQIICLGLLAGPRAGLLGRRAVRTAMVVDVATTVVFLIATIGGGLADGALGALWAVAIGQLLLAGVWWTLFLRQLTATPAPVPVAVPVVRPRPVRPRPGPVTPSGRVSDVLVRSVP